MRKVLIVGIIIVLLAISVWAWNYDECSVIQTISVDGATVQIVDGACKEGLPHTTDARTIRMTADVWGDPRRRAEIMTHERVHLRQKSDLGAWAKFYAGAWGYKCYARPPADIPRELVERLRPNPDTADAPWAVWRDRWVFFPAYSENASLRGAEVIVWDTELHRQVPLPDAWRALFCGRACPHQYEHPHEISAEWLTARSDAAASGPLYKWGVQGIKTE